MCLPEDVGDWDFGKFYTIWMCYYLDPFTFVYFIYFFHLMEKVFLGIFI